MKVAMIVAGIIGAALLVYLCVVWLVSKETYLDTLEDPEDNIRGD